MKTINLKKDSYDMHTFEVSIIYTGSYYKLNYTLQLCDKRLVRRLCPGTLGEIPITQGVSYITFRRAFHFIGDKVEGNLPFFYEDRFKGNAIDLFDKIQSISEAVHKTVSTNSEQLKIDLEDFDIVFGNYRDKSPICRAFNKFVDLIEKLHEKYFP